ncbi:MAG: DUF6790 family protein [Dehalococcoidia bacterium]|jgi:hypothetical protein
MTTRILLCIRYAVIFVGTFAAYFFYFQWHDVRPASEIILLTCVGINGLLAFFSHTILHKSDAKRLGMETANPGFQYEVGFANLAFGVTAILAFLGHWGVIANTVLILGFSLYILQIVILHLCRYISGEKRGAGYLGGSILASGLYTANMIFFAVAAMLQEHLAPF